MIKRIAVTLVGILCSAAMLGAVGRLVAEGRAPLATAWACVSTKPARALKLTDRGEIRVGKRADLTAVDWPEGGTPAGRAKAAGYAGRGVVAENIAKGLFEPAETVERWMDSSGHRRNILHRRVTATGLGLAIGPGEHECYDVLWVQLFAA